MIKIILTIGYFVLTLVFAWLIQKFLDKNIKNDFLYVFNYVLFTVPFFIFGVYLLDRGFLEPITFLIFFGLYYLFGIIKDIVKKEFLERSFGILFFGVPFYFLLAIILSKYLNIWIAITFAIMLASYINGLVITLNDKNRIKILSLILFVVGLVSLVFGYWKEFIEYLYSPDIFTFFKLVYVYIVFILFIWILFFQSKYKIKKK